ncbi:MAG TPA: glycosyltransferase family 4 protein [Pirellulales bacterium]|nr:glycosyltransferase family 4 protein [Pirellulales bacterium]
MRLAVVTFFPGKPWYASESLWNALAHEALTRGDDVAICTLQATDQGEQYAALERRGAQIFQRRLFRRGLSYRLFSRSQFNDLWRFQPDVVFVSQPGPLCITSYLDAKIMMHRLMKMDIPYAVMSHNNGDFDTPRVEAWRDAGPMFAKAKLVGQYSEASRRMLERQIARALPQSRVFINPVNLASIDPVAWPSESRPAMAVVARLLSAVKGQDTLFEALAERRVRAQDWIVRLFGQGDDLEYLKALASYYGIERSVEFCGHVGDIRAVWANHHLLAIPSRFEYGPMVMVEAMLCARPVLSTPMGFVPEWIEDGTSGFLTTAFSADSLAEGLERAWAARDSWQAIGQRARARALELYDPDVGATLYTALRHAAGMEATPREATVPV